MTTESPPADDQAISLPAAGRLMPIDGKPLSGVTVWRYARKGKLGVRLQVWKRGRRLVTTPKAVREFETAVAEADRQRWAEHAGEATPSKTQDDVEARATRLGV